MKTSEALLELADAAWKGGALSADQVLAILRKIEMDAPARELPAGEMAYDVSRDEPVVGQYGTDEPAAREEYAPGEEVWADGSVKPVKPE